MDTETCQNSVFNVDRNSPGGSPVDPGTFDAHGDSQVDGGPARIFLSAFAAALVPGAPQGHAQHRRPLGGRAWRGVTTRGQRRRISGLKEERQKQIRTLKYEICVY